MENWGIETEEYSGWTNMDNRNIGIQEYTGWRNMDNRIIYILYVILTFLNLLFSAILNLFQQFFNYKNTYLFIIHLLPSFYNYCFL